MSVMAISQKRGDHRSGGEGVSLQRVPSHGMILALNAKKTRSRGRSYQMELDRTDHRILALLQEDGRRSNVEIAERVALSPSPCLRRIKRLEATGVIRSVSASPC
jgi:predicted HTH transcriptional regulator